MQALTRLLQWARSSGGDVDAVGFVCVLQKTAKEEEREMRQRQRVGAAENELQQFPVVRERTGDGGEERVQKQPTVRGAASPNTAIKLCREKERQQKTGGEVQDLRW